MVSKQRSGISIPQFLTGGGEMGKLIREYDWASTSIGAIDTWPQSLQTCIRIMLTSRQPIWIGWGKELIKFYNDPYQSIVGGKHPWALGKPASEVWKDIWKDIEPLLKQVMEHNEGNYSESQLLIMERNGYPEETYYTFSYTPIPGDDGKPQGMFCANSEDTERIINERQLRTLTILGKNLTDTKSEEEVIIRSIEALEKNAHDFPFAFVCRVEDNLARVVRSSNFSGNEDLIPEVLDMGSDHILAIAIALSMKNRQAQVVNDLAGTIGQLPKGVWAVSPDKAIVLPLYQTAGKEPFGALVLGLNPFRLPDEKYRAFLNLVADQVNTSFADVFAFEEERKRAEALAQIDQAKTAFFTNISHEFRTPLTLILGSLEMQLRKRGMDPSDQLELETTHRNALRLLRLVNNLLDFSRLEAGKAKVNYQRTNIGEYTRDLSSHFRSAIEAAGLEFRVNTTSFKDDVYLDRTMWEKIVLNLLSNAFKFTITGMISVNLFEEGDEIVLQVIDTGLGIPSSELPNIFQRFHRVENDRGRTYEGTGIGLSLVKELVELHGGTISVTSELNKGTTFTVSIPKSRDRVEVTLTDKEQTDFSGTLANAFLEEANFQTEYAGGTQGETTDGRATILVVDDNSDMRNYVRSVLMQKDYSVITASNGAEALEHIREKVPDLVVSDVMMPVMNGVEMLKQIKNDPATSTLPVILLSARAGEDERIEGYDLGADDYLVKPFSSKELLARIKSHLQLQKNRGELVRNIYNVFEEVPFAVAVLMGKDLVIEFINKYNLDIWDAKREDVVGKPLHKVFPGNWAGVSQIHEDIFRTGNRFVSSEVKVELEVNGRQEVRYFDAIVDPMLNEQGQIIGQLATSIDVTEKVEARNKIEEKEQHLRNIISQVNAGIAQTNMQGRLVEVNERFCQITGYSREELLGMTVKQLTHPDDWQRNKDLFREAVTEGRSFFIEKRYLHKNGSVVWVNNSVSVIRGMDGDLFVTAVSIDVSDQVRSLQKVRESESLFRNILEQAPDPIFLLKGEQMILQAANEPFFRLVNLNRDLIGKTLPELFPGKDTGGLLKNVFRNSEVIEDFEVPVQGEAPGGTGYYNFTYQPYRDADGNTIGVMGIATNVTAQVMSRKILEEKEQYLGKVTDNLPAIIWITDVNAHCTYLNPNWYEYTGQTEEEALGFGWLNATHPDDKEESGKRFLEATENRQPFSILYRLRNSSGEYRWAMDKGSPRYDVDGTFEGYIGTVVDVHEQKLAEEKIREAEERYATTVYASDLGLWDFDVINQEIVAAGKMFRIYGLASNDEYTLEQLQNSIHPEDVIPQMKIFNDVLEGKMNRSFITEYRIIQKNSGEVRWIRANGFAFFKDGKLYRTVGTVADITEQKEIENAIRQSEERFRTLAETLPQMIWVTDDKGNNEYYNAQWEEYCGISDPKMQWSKIVHPDDADSAEDNFQRAFQSGNPFRCEIRLKNIKGEYRWHTSIAEPVRDTNGKIVKWIGSLTDIHDQKTLSETLEQLVLSRTAELQRSNEDLQHFAHVASHDLKEPVRKIRTFGSRLLDEFGIVLPERARTYLSKIDLASMRMYSMIDGVLSYSSLNAFEQKTEPVDLTSVIRNIETDLEMIIDQQEGKIIYNDLPVVEGSPVLIYQLFYNLLSNALKFARPGAPPAILLKWKEIALPEEPGERKFLEITIEDNGIGFNQEESERIFQTFYRLNSKDSYEGTGLGLALCKKIVERHGGTIKAFSTPGVGSRFVVLLPAGN